MFQAWNAAELARSYFGVPGWVSGITLALLVGLVIIGGIRRIGQAAATLVPFMCLIYVLCGLWVLLANAEELPRLFTLIVRSAFSPLEAQGAFTGAAVGTAFLLGMRRALFSSEAGMGSAPIAHAAVRTRKPASEGVVAGLEPFIDTIVVCTITALVILSSGVWERGPTATLDSVPAFTQDDSGQWIPDIETLPAQAAVDTGGQVFLIVRTGDSGNTLERLYAEVGDGERLLWQGLAAADPPSVRDLGLYLDLPAAALTAAAFDSAAEGLGRWMVTIAVWLFALSTMITWSYYAEQGVVYLAGDRPVLTFRLVWCLLIVVATVGVVRTDAELDTLSTVAIGFMLAINLPLMLLLAHKAIAAQRSYFADLKGERQSS